VIRFICKILFVYITIILSGERIILHFQKKTDCYIEEDDVLDKIGGFFVRCLWPTFIIWIFSLLAKICVDF
jgi:hypothetical protein